MGGTGEKGQGIGEVAGWLIAKHNGTFRKITQQSQNNAADAPLRPKEVAELLGKKYDTVAKTLQRMAKEGTIIKDNYGKYSCPSCPSSPSSPTCPSCPSGTKMDAKLGLGHELGHPNEPQTRINTELGQDGQLGHMDSNLNVQPDGLGHPNESGVQTWDDPDPDDDDPPREVFIF